MGTHSSPCYWSSIPYHHLCIHHEDQSLDFHKRIYEVVRWYACKGFPRQGISSRFWIPRQWKWQIWKKASICWLAQVLECTKSSDQLLGAYLICSCLWLDCWTCIPSMDYWNFIIRFRWSPHVQYWLHQIWTKGKTSRSFDYGPWYPCWLRIHDCCQHQNWRRSLNRTRVDHYLSLAI